MDKSNLFLALDVAGNPSAWINAEMAIHMISTDRVLAPLGAHSRVFHGGINARTGIRSTIEVSSILLTNSRVHHRRWQRDYQPPLTNAALFARDGNLCLYCGDTFSRGELTRDHIVPVSRGGRHSWENSATACRSCNHRKGAKTPEEWGVKLIAIPYAPCYAEHLILSGKRILADQMEFLQARVRRKQ